MKRARRRPVREHTEITPAVALEYERDGWPSAKERHEFWNGDGVPVGLRDRDEPDPRVVLGGELDAARRYKERVEEWQRQRSEWLQDVAGAS